MKETLAKYKFFTPDNYEKEEKFLRSMSLKGWHFESLALIKYKFAKGQPKSYSYKLDFKKNIKEDKESYVALYEDFGWEHFYEFPVFGGVWVYFRKESEINEEEALFTDNESKIDLLSRIQKTYLWIMMFVAAINIINIVNIFNLFKRGQEQFGVLIVVMLVLMISLYIKIQARISKKIKRLKNRRANQFT